MYWGQWRSLSWRIPAYAKALSRFRVSPLFPFTASHFATVRSYCFWIMGIRYFWLRCSSVLRLVCSSSTDHTAPLKFKGSVVANDQWEPSVSPAICASFGFFLPAVLSSDSLCVRLDKPPPTWMYSASGEFLQSDSLLCGIASRPLLLVSWLSGESAI